MSNFEFSENYASEIFDQFILANTMRTVVTNFKRVCNVLDIKCNRFDIFYPVLKKGVLNKNNWKAKSIFSKLDKKTSSNVYKKDNLCNEENNILKGQNCLIIGGGPCGLRTAIELQLLGSNHVIIVEKRDRISRNNVVHLWPFVIHDLKQLAGKKLYAKFCPGSIDHISIRQLQLMLLKVALILGCDFVDNVAFEQICPLSIQNPNNKLKNSSNNVNLDEIYSRNSSLDYLDRKNEFKCICCCHQHISNEVNQNTKQIGAYAHFKFNNNSNYPSIVNKLNSFSFNILIGADGRRNTLSDYFVRKEFRGRLAIAITANFINNHTLAETQVPEISGISFIYYQELFKSLQKETGIDLENICYYKDDTHYFVMTAKKSSLLARNVLIEDFQDTQALLSPDNINQSELLNYANDAAKWTTGLSSIQFALNHYGQADVAMFDFTSMYAAENACRVKEIYLKNCFNHNILDKKCCSIINNPNSSFLKTHSGLLLTALVGDSLLEPFWPTGSGCGRGFLSSMDAAWMCRQWAMKLNPSNLNYDTNDAKKFLQLNEESILNVLSERESIYRLLAQTKSENLNQNLKTYTINPYTRYPNLNTISILPIHCKHLLYTGLICPKKLNKQSLEEKRLRRITIACTPDTFIQRKQNYNFNSNFNNEKNLDLHVKNKMTYIPNKFFLNNETFENNIKTRKKLDFNINNLTNKTYITPSAYNLASIGKNRTLEIQNVIKHRKQREEKLNNEILNIYKSNNEKKSFNEISSEQRFINHIQKQIKSKASWFLSEKLNYNDENKEFLDKNRNKIEDFESFSKDNNLNENYVQFSKKVSNLEEKLNENKFDKKKNVLNIPQSCGNGINVMMAKLNLQELLDPKKQHEKFQAKVKRKAFLEKDYKFVGKLKKNDWNIKLFNTKKDEIQIDKDSLKDLNKNLPSRPKELLAIFKQNKQNIENLLANGEKNKTDLIERKKLKDFEQRSNGKCGEWIEKLKNELNKKQNNSKQIKTQNLDIRNEFFDNDKEIKKNKLINHNEKSNSNVKISFLKQEVDKSKIGSLYNLILPNTNNIKYTNDNCVRCHQKVLTVDKIIISGIIFHRNCLTCTKCDLTLRLNEVRPVVEKNREKNMEFFDKNYGEFDCVCSLCSKTISSSSSEINSTNLPKEKILNEFSLMNHHTNNYEFKLKEKMKWKELFLLNTDLTHSFKENVYPVSERIEYENTSTFELYDDEEITKMLNLDVKNDLTNGHDSEEYSNSEDKKIDFKILNKNKNEDNYFNSSNFSNGDENDFDEEDSSTDTTGADFNSDQFDLSEENSHLNKSESIDDKYINKNIKDNLPKIIIYEDKNFYKQEIHEQSHNENDNTLNEKILNSISLEKESKNSENNICNENKSKYKFEKNIFKLDEFNDSDLKTLHLPIKKKNEKINNDLLIRHKNNNNNNNIKNETEEEESDFKDLTLKSILEDEDTLKEKYLDLKENLTKESIDNDENLIKPSVKINNIQFNIKVENSYKNDTSSSIIENSFTLPSALNIKTFSFKVEKPKLLTTERYSKIPVLKNRIFSDNEYLYGGSFVEKLIKCRSSPCLNKNFYEYLFNENKVRK